MHNERISREWKIAVFQGRGHLLAGQHLLDQVDGGSEGSRESWDSGFPSPGPELDLTCPHICLQPCTQESSRDSEIACSRLLPNHYPAWWNTLTFSNESSTRWQLRVLHEEWGLHGIPESQKLETKKDVEVRGSWSPGAARGFFSVIDSPLFLQPRRLPPWRPLSAVSREDIVYRNERSESIPAWFALKFIYHSQAGKEGKTKDLKSLVGQCAWAEMGGSWNTLELRQPGMVDLTLACCVTSQNFDLSKPQFPSFVKWELMMPM